MYYRQITDMFVRMLHVIVLYIFKDKNSAWSSFVVVFKVLSGTYGGGILILR